LADSTPETAKNNYVTRSTRIIRRKPLPAAIKWTSAPPVESLAAALAGTILLHAAAFAEGPAWDCRAAPDGRGWQCYQDGKLVPDQAAPSFGPDRPSATPQSDTEAPLPGTEQTPPPADAQPVRPPAQPAVSPPAPAGADTGQPAVPRPRHLPTPPGDIETVPAGQSNAQPTGKPSKPRLPQTPQPAAPTERAPPPAEPRMTAPAVSHDPALQAFRHDGSPDLLPPPAAATAAAAQQPPPADHAPPTAVVRAQAVAAPTAFASAIDQGIDWDTCGAAPAALPVDRTPAAADGIPGPLEISADAAVASLDPEQAVFSGNVQLVRGDLRMQADELVLNRTTGEVDARGRLMAIRPDVRVAGSAAHYRLASGQGQIEQAIYRVPAIGARGEAQRAEFLGHGQSRYQDISYTTCRPGNSDWLLSAETLELDHREGLGRAGKAKLRFLGVPLLYAPAFSFPIDDRRRSGLLVPSLGYSDNTGVDLSVPYYLNLAENYDLTLTPRLMSRRGAMLGGEFRFLTATTAGTLAAEYLPNDLERPGSDQDRGSGSLRSHTQFTPRAEGAVRLGYVSDSDYVNDLGDSLAVTSTTHIERAGELRYHGDSWHVLGRLQGYQTIDDLIPRSDRPYSRLPQLLVELEHPDGIAGTRYHLSAEYVNFYREDAVHGHRVDLFPALSLPLRETWGYVEPKIGVRYTAYRLTDQAPAMDDAPSHLAGMFSLDGGLYFDRKAGYLGTAVTQTLEPRLHYLLVPKDGQNDQPIFDTAPLDFSFDNLFRENRFNGADRFGDANQLTLALTSRMIGDRSGAELLRASIGQILYFENREVTLPGEAVADDNASAVVGELAARLGGGWQTRAGLQWDPHDGSSGTIDQALAQISYRDDRRRVLNAAYRLRDGVTQHTDLAAIWPVSERLSLIGRHHYSLRDDRLLEALAGLEYGHCCWRVRALLRQFTDSAGSDHNLAFLLQLELNGLGRLGNKIDQTLEHGIYGYRTDDD
jgi:LPS-assembly protein